MKKYIMVIDQGTTSSRAIIYNQKGNVVSLARRELQNYYPSTGYVEQDAQEIWASVVGVMFEAYAKSGITTQEISAISITNQRETTVCFDRKTGVPIHNAIVWQSRQSESYCKERQDKSDIIKKKTGLLVDPYFSASKIRYILDKTNCQQRANDGEILFSTIDSWLVYKLTNGKKHVTDVSNASRTMLVNLETLDYDDELLDIWDIPRCMLPTIVDTSGIVGYTENIFETAIPIATIVGDQQASLFGHTCFYPGSVKNTYGTGCFLLMNTGDTIIHSHSGLVTSIGWKIGNEVNYVLEGSVFNAGAAINWLRDGIKIIEQSKDSETMANACDDDQEIYVVPAFTGLGAPYWKPLAKGAMYGLTRNTTRKHITKATLESLAYQTYDVVEAMQQDSNIMITTLQVDGGVSKNNYLLQFQSDILNVPVSRGTDNEVTALGAFYLAALATGMFTSKEEIIALQQKKAIFNPTIENNLRKHKIKKWKKAVAATILFE